MKINDEIELRILNVLLIQARFYDNNYDRKDYYGSPFTGKIHKKIIDALQKIKSSNGKLMYYQNESDFLIEKYHDCHIWIENIKKHITNIDEWSKLSLENKEGVIHDFIYPFILSQETIKDLCSLKKGQSSS